MENVSPASKRLSMEEILTDALRRQATYQVQFADYDLDTWTVPCKLTKNRMNKLLDDGSIRKIRLELEMQHYTQPTKLIHMNELSIISYLEANTDGTFTKAMKAWKELLESDLPR